MKLTITCVLAMMLLASVHAQITVNKAVDGKHATITTISAGGAPGVSTGAAAGGEASSDSDMAAGPSQQPAKANPPDQPSSRFAPPNAAWQATAALLSFSPLSNIRVLSPFCTNGTEATSCAAFSGNTAVVVSSVMAAIGTNTNVKTTQCFCDFRNTVNAFLPASQLEVYRCAAMCQ